MLSSYKKASQKNAMKKKIIVRYKSRSIGFMIPIGSWILKKKYLIQKLVKWREKNKHFFFFQKKFSYEDLLFYLSNFAIRDKKRLLFLIYDKSKKAVGHIGVSNLNYNSCQLDNMIRGEKTKEKHLMLAAEETILSFAFNKLNCKKILGVLWKDNILMLNIHKKFGFKIYRKSYEHNPTLKLKLMKIYILLLKKEFNLICEK
jgi:RimJ/RimL family protein N-acetyltransferase